MASGVSIQKMNIFNEWTVSNELLHKSDAPLGQPTISDLGVFLIQPNINHLTRVTLLGFNFMFVSFREYSSDMEVYTFET